MLKYYDYAVTMAEFPDEIALCVNISNCPGMCKNCSEPWLLQDIGTELTNDEIDMLICSHQDCSLFGLMGGDSDHTDVKRVAKYIKEKYNIKVGFYSGKEAINIELIPFIDIYKIGRWIMPDGNEETWYKNNCGPLQFPFSNQLYFEKINGELHNATWKFRKQPINDLSRYILKTD